MNTNEFRTSLSKLRPDEDTKERMLNNILAGKRTYSIHKRSFAPFVATAAAIFLFAGGFLYYNNNYVNDVYNNKVAINEKAKTNEEIFENFDKNSDNGATEKSIKSKSAKEKEEQKISDNVYVKNENVKENKADNNTLKGGENIAVEEKNTEQHFEKTDEERVFGLKVAVNDISDASINEFEASSLDSDFVVSETTDEVLGGGVSSSAKMVVKTMGEEEYFSYLGYNFRENLYVPNGYSYCGFNDLYADCDDEGNLINDTADFLYAGDSDSYFDIKTSKKDSLNALEKYKGYEKSNFDGEDVVITKDNDTYSAYFVSNGIFYEVRSYLVLKDEFVKIIKSIL